MDTQKEKNNFGPVKILFIHNRYRQAGGEEVVVEEETSILKERGHEVQSLIFNNSEIDGLPGKLSAAFKSFYNPVTAKELKKKMKKFRPDVIHVHNLFFIASPSMLYTAYRLKIPVVFTLHNYRLICANALLLRKDKICETCINKKFPLAGIRHKCYRHSASESALVTLITGLHKLAGTWKNKIAAYISLNEFSRSLFLRSSLQVPEHKMITKPHFVPDPGEGCQPRENFFLFAGRIAPEKGVHVLTTAFASMPEYRIIIIGEGPEKKYLQQKFKPYPNITFDDQLDKVAVWEYMKRCRAFICPSVWYEGAPLTLLEAFASGTPVIGSRLGSMAESICDGYNGFLFTAGDSFDLQDKIRLFIKETESNPVLYHNARQTYLEKYHPDIHYKKIIEIYETAIANYNV